MKKVFRCQKSLTLRFMIPGLVILALAIYMVYDQIVTGKTIFSNLEYTLTAIVLSLAFGIFYTIRPFTIIFEIKDDEAFYWDGLTDTRHFKYDEIEYLEYTPNVRLRFHMNNSRHQVLSINNFFTDEDYREIIKQIQGKRHRIKMVESAPAEKLVRIIPRERKTFLPKKNKENTK